MTFKLTNNQPSKRLSRFLPWVAFGLCFFLILSSSITQAERITVNPYEWIPVITEFQIDQRLTRPMKQGPEWTKIKDESEDPNKPKPRSIPKDWKILKNMAKIRLRGQQWWEEEPVISGWRTWVDEEGESGIEVMRSDNKVPEDGLPLRNFLLRDLVVGWKIEIWGGYKFKDPDPDNPTLSLLGPGDQEYQDLIKKKIEVRDFSLKVYKVEGDLSLENIKNEVSPQSLKDLGRTVGTLADYERQDYYSAFRGETGHIGEIQLKMKLFFRELDEHADTWEETPVEVSLRYISAENIMAFGVLQMEWQRVR